MTVLYRCDECGELYCRQESAMLCELLHDGWDKRKALIFLKEDLCDRCDHAYYVYGCERDCKYKQECNYSNKYEKFKAKNKED